MALSQRREIGDWMPGIKHLTLEWRKLLQDCGHAATIPPADVPAREKLHGTGAAIWVTFRRYADLGGI
jgi:hypothetical protein